MASRKIHETAGLGDRGAGPNRGSSGAMKPSANSQSKVLEAKLDFLMSEVANLTYNMENLSEKAEASRIAFQSGETSSNYSQTIILKNKLDSLMLEITNLTSNMGNISASVGAHKESVNEISKSLPTLETRVRMLELSVVRLHDDDDRPVQGIDKRISSLEKALDKLKHHKFPDIEMNVNGSLNDIRNKFLPSLEARLNLLESSQSTTLHAVKSRLNALESSQNELQLSALDSIEGRFSRLESSQNQTISYLGNRLKVLETSVNKLQDQELPTIENRFSSLKSSLEKRQDKDKAEARKDVNELATVVDVLCNENLSDEEAKTAKDMAERFGMRNTVNKLSSFLRNTLTLITCVQLFKQEFGQTLITHKNAAWKMILQNFNTVSESAVSFCELSLDELRCFLYSSELRATAEQIFNAISKWVEKDRLSRTSMASLLLPAVQFSSCSLTFLRRLRGDILVKAHSTVQQSVEEAIKNFCSDVLFVLGGGSSKGIIETLNKSKSSWIEQKNISNGPSETTFAYTAGPQILVLEEDFKRFRSFDTLTKKWKNLRPLPAFRRYLSAAMEGNELFVIGGHGEHQSRCDIYDVRLDSWTEGTSLNVGRFNPASSSLRGKIYCCGGSATGGLCLSSMEMFDPNKKSKGWTKATSMSVRRREHCLVSCGQYLWAIGGWDGSSSLTALEKFNPTTNAWTKMASMPAGREDLTACFLGGLLYSIGGDRGSVRSLNTVEVYDPVENRWTTGAPLNRGRRWSASCVVKEMSNADKYQWFVSF